MIVKYNTLYETSVTEKQTNMKTIIYWLTSLYSSSKENCKKKYTFMSLENVF